MSEEEIIKMLRAALDTDKVDAWGNGFWTITNEELLRYAKFVEIAALLNVEERIKALLSHEDPIVQSGAMTVLKELRREK